MNSKQTIDWVNSPLILATKSQGQRFNDWLDTFVHEKNLNTETVFEVEGEEYGMNYIPCAVVIEHMKIATLRSKTELQKKIIEIDFHNGDVMDYFRHLAQGIAM